MNTQRKRSTGKLAKAKRPKRKSLNVSRGGPPWDWGNIEQKRKAFLKIMNEIIDNPDLGQEYLGSDEKAAQAFRDAGMNVPNDIKVVFLPAGDSAKLTRASAVLQLPLVEPNKPRPTPDELMELMVANYTIVW